MGIFLVPGGVSGGGGGGSSSALKALHTDGNAVFHNTASYLTAGQASLDGSDFQQGDAVRIRAWFEPLNNSNAGLRIMWNGTQIVTVGDSLWAIGTMVCVAADLIFTAAPTVPGSLKGAVHYWVGDDGSLVPGISNLNPGIGGTAVVLNPATPAGAFTVDFDVRNLNTTAGVQYYGSSIERIRV